MKVDFVLASTLWRFDERQGNSISAKKTASVGFAVFLVNVKTGDYWQDLFDKTQTALTENLLESRLYATMGVRWLTARELADYGVKTIFTDLLGK